LAAVNATFYPFYLGRQSARPSYNRMIRSIDLIGQFCRSERGRVRIWYDREESAGWEFMSIAAAYFYENSLINEHFPSLAAGHPAQITAGEPLVIISRNGDAGTIADRALRERVLTYRTLCERVVGSGADGYSLTFGIVEPRSADGGISVSS